MRSGGALLGGGSVLSARWAHGVYPPSPWVRCALSTPAGASEATRVHSSAEVARAAPWVGGRVERRAEGAVTRAALLHPLLSPPPPRFSLSCTSHTQVCAETELHISTLLTAPNSGVSS